MYVENTNAKVLRSLLNCVGCVGSWVVWVTWVKSLRGSIKFWRGPEILLGSIFGMGSIFGVGPKLGVSKIFDVFKYR